MPARRYILAEVPLPTLQARPPRVAVLPWGATEAHGPHLPHGTDVIEAVAVAERSAQLADAAGARVVVLPAIPFGNNAQQLDQVATIHLSTPTAIAILDDVCASLVRQGIDRLVLVNGHGGNDFKPLVRDAQLRHGILIVVADFFRQAPDVKAATFERPGDHADEMETSLIMHLAPHLVDMTGVTDATGSRHPLDIPALRDGHFWTPRPWSAIHPDTACGDARLASAEKGARYFDAVCDAIAKLLVDLSNATKGDLPYL